MLSLIHILLSSSERLSTYSVIIIFSCSKCPKCPALVPFCIKKELTKKCAKWIIVSKNRASLFPCRWTLGMLLWNTFEIQRKVTSPPKFTIFFPLKLPLDLPICCGYRWVLLFAHLRVTVELVAQNVDDISVSTTLFSFKQELCLRFKTWLIIVVACTLEMAVAAKECWHLIKRHPDLAEQMKVQCLSVVDDLIRPWLCISGFRQNSDSWFHDMFSKKRSSVWI